jgi:hypothetical protein
VKKYVRNALLSDDGGPAIELSEHLADGQKTTGVPATATDLLKGFIDACPRPTTARSRSPSRPAGSPATASRPRSRKRRRSTPRAPPTSWRPRSPSRAWGPN